jgi:hypothetical protein
MENRPKIFFLSNSTTPNAGMQQGTLRQYSIVQNQHQQHHQQQQQQYVYIVTYPLITTVLPKPGPALVCQNHPGDKSQVHPNQLLSGSSTKNSPQVLVSPTLQKDTIHYSVKLNKNQQITHLIQNNNKDQSYKFKFPSGNDLDLDYDCFGKEDYSNKTSPGSNLDPIAVEESALKSQKSDKNSLKGNQTCAFITDDVITKDQLEHRPDLDLEDSSDLINKDESKCLEFSALEDLASHQTKRLRHDIIDTSAEVNDSAAETLTVTETNDLEGLESAMEIHESSESVLKSPELVLKSPEKRRYSEVLKSPKVLNMAKVLKTPKVLKTSEVLMTISQVLKSPKVLNTPEALKTPKALKSPEVLKSLEVLKSPEVLMTPEVLKTILEEHAPSFHQRIPCPLCKLNSSPFSLLLHLKKVHGSTIFTQVSLAKLRLVNENYDQNTPVCQQCPSEGVIKDWPHFYKHVFEKHTGRYPMTDETIERIRETGKAITCMGCPELFTNELDLIQHLRQSVIQLQSYIVVHYPKDIKILKSTICKDTM